MKIHLHDFVLTPLLLAVTLLFVFQIAQGEVVFSPDKEKSFSLAPAPIPINENAINTIIPDFVAADTIIYVNTPVKFHNLTTGGATFFKWTFEGGAPKDTYHANPTIMYYTPGFYDVTLQAYGMSGNSTITKENYIQVLEVETGLPPGWDYNTTISQQIIAIPFDANPRIFENPIEPGDFIGVFYFDNFNQLKCAGATKWTGTGAEMIVANGNDAFTPLKDGFYPGEAINWKIHSVASGEDFPAIAAWDPDMPIQEIFIPNGISALTDLYAGVVYELEIQYGWSAISSPVEPWNKSLDALFGSALGEITVMSNNDGIFYPNGNINTLGDWQNKGYVIKMNQAATIQVKGYPIEQIEEQMQVGWNLLPVFVACEVDLAELYQKYPGKIEMVKEVAGLKSYSPASGIFTLATLLPGKAYLLLAAEQFVLQIDPCP